MKRIARFVGVALHSTLCLQLNPKHCINVDKGLAAVNIGNNGRPW